MSAPSALRRVCTALATASLGVAGLTVTAPPASAADPVTTWTELTSAFLAGGSVRLGAHLSQDDGRQLTVPVDRPVELDLNGYNLTISGVASMRAAIEVPRTASLTVTDTVDDETPNQLSVTGGANAAGIGGGWSIAAGTVIIRGATVTATAGNGGAGIGGGRASAGGSVTIAEGSTVVASGGDSGGGAGIGGGNSGQLAGDVTISDSDVTATSATYGSGTGIGGGVGGLFGGRLEIKDSIVRAQAIGGAPAVGGYYNGKATVRVESGRLQVSSSGIAIGNLYGTVSPDVQIDPGAEIDVSFGTALGNTDANAAGWGPVVNDGTLRLRAGASLALPTGASMTNDGLITGAGQITGAGTIVNTGRIDETMVSGYGQGGGSLTRVTKNSFILRFDENRPDTGIALPAQPVLADTVADHGGSLGRPEDRVGYTFTGWYSDPEPGAGTRVTDTTVLTEALGDGPREVTLYAHYGDPYDVSDWSSLRQAFNNDADHIRLTADITAPAAGHLTVPESVGLDLNGKKLTITGIPFDHAAIGVPAGAALTISDPVGNGQLVATGGYGAAGIGGAWYSAGGAVTIQGTSKVIATGGTFAAGIGGGSNGGAGGTVRVQDSATVEARGGTLGAGIGGGLDGDGGTLTTQGASTVDATGSEGSAGVGGGFNGDGGTVTTQGASTLTANGGDGGGAGVGGGEHGSGGTLTAQDTSTVNATGGPSGAGVGGGLYGSGVTVTTNDHSTLNATGGPSGAGIGGGQFSAGGTVTTNDDSIVDATGGEGAAGVGGGEGGDAGAPGDTVTTNDHSILNARGGSPGGAGIGGGYSTLGGAGGNLVVNDASRVEATGGGDGPGVGGYGGGRSTVVVNGGLLEASSTGTAVGGGASVGADVTVADGAEIQIRSGRAFGHTSGTAGTWGTVVNDGTVRLLTGTSLRVPEDVSMTNGGLITGGRIEGTGTVVNTGRILDSEVAGDGQGAPGTTVTTNSFVLSFDENRSPAGSFDDVRVLAATLTAAETWLPEPAPRSGYTFLGWYTAPAAGQGTRIQADTPLPGALGAGPRRVTLYAHYQIAQTITFTTTPPATATVGGTYSPTAVGGGSSSPVVFSVDDATTGDACSVDSAGVVSFDRAGMCVIAADQAGDDDYTAAPRMTQSIAVGAASTTTSVVLSPPSVVFGQPATATATITGAPGTVQFEVDDKPHGSPVAVTGGTATSAPITGAVGARQVRAVFTPADTGTHTGSSATATLTVDPAATTTELTVTGDQLSAKVAPVAPGAGTPTGTVTFTIAGRPVVGTAPVVNGTATLAHTVPADAAQTVAATYAGDGSFTGSSDSTSRTNPTLTGRVTTDPNAKGWHAGPVTVRFTCTPTTAPLTAPCPAPVRLTKNGAGQTVTRTIHAADGGTATTTVRGIKIDQTKPKLRVTRAGTRLTCRATDALSGIQKCTIRKKTRPTATGTRTTWTATATDQAGNRRTRTGAFTTRDTILEGVPMRGGRYQVTLGDSYRLVVTSKTRPTYYHAERAPVRPHVRGPQLHPAGKHTWALTITIDPGMHTGGHWHIGIKTGDKMRILPLQVSR